MENEISQRLQEVLYRCQAWIDDEKYIPRKFKVKSRGDEFAEQIVHELEAVMVREKFCFRHEKIYLPTFYFIQISQANSLEFCGRKRDVLCEELDKFVERYLRMFSIESQRTSFVQISVNPSLEKDEIKIVHQWEESYLPEIRFNKPASYAASADFEDLSENTVITPAFWRNEPYEDEEYETVIGKKLKCLYHLEILKNGAILNSLPVFQNEIIIGRGSPTRPVDIGLSDDLEISRQHALLSLHTEDVFNLSIVGQNAAFASENYLLTGQNAYLTWNDQFQIGSYLLSIRR